MIAVLAMANVYIFSKAALEEVNLHQFGLYWFTLGFVWAMLFVIFLGTYKDIKYLNKKAHLTLIFLGITEVVATYYFYRAIQVIANPSIVAFIGNLTPVFVIVLSVIFFKERYNFVETFGILLTIFGAFVISFQRNSHLNQLFIYGAQFILINSFLSAVNAIIIKHNIKNINPIILTTNRIIYIMLFFMIIFPWGKENLQISPRALFNISIGSFVGPVLAGIAGYMTYKYLKVSRIAIVDSFRGLLVVIGAYTYFGKFPQKIALVGGLISIVGVLFIAIGKLKFKEKD